MGTVLFLYNFVLKALLLLLVFFLGYKYVVKYRLNKINYVLLFGLHYILTFLGWMFTLNSKTDATYYLRKATEASSWFDTFGLSSKMISFIMYPMLHYLKFDFQLLILIFSSFSFFGFLILYKLINKIDHSQNNTILGIKTQNIILFLPSFHFWVCLLGKDSLIFFFFTLFLDKVEHWRQKKLQLSIILLFILFIRPYIVIFLLASFAICFLFLSLNSFKKVLLFILLLIVLSIVTLQVFKTLNLDVFTFLSERLEFVTGYFDKKEGTGSFIDPSEYNSLSKMFMYLFSPTIIGASGLFQIYIALENLLILIIFVKLLYNFSFKLLRKNVIIAVLLLYTIIFLFIKSYLLYNLGLANRQKYMILPTIFYIMFMFYSYQNSKKKLSKQHV